MMTILVTIVHVFVCLVLIMVILLQAGRGQGLGSGFSGGEGTQSIFGTRSSDFLSKATSVCAILFLFTCIGLDILHARKGQSLFETSPKLKTEDVEALQKALAKLQEEEAGKPSAASTETPAVSAEQTAAVPAAEPLAASDVVEIPAPVVETKTADAVPSEPTATPAPSNEPSTVPAETAGT